MNREEASGGSGVQNDRSMAAIMLPDLGFPPAVLTLSVWLVRLGAHVGRGDRVVEILTGEAIVDLPAPAAGTLVKKERLEDDPVEPGQVLGWIRCDAP